MMISIDATAKERMTAVATEPSGAATAPVAAGLSAEPAERLGRGRAPSSFTGFNRWVALAAAFVLHVAILAPLWLQFDRTPITPPPSEAIPIEIVVEPPQPTPQPSASPEAPPKPPVDLQPAHDAPKAATDDKAEPHEGVDAKKNAETAPPDQPQTGQKQPSSDEAKSAEPTPDQTADAKPDSEPLKPSDDALAAAAAPPATVKEPDSPPKVALLTGQPMPTWSKDKQYSTFKPIPDVAFGDAAASPIGGGAAQTTYLTVIYGLIMKHLRMTDALRAEAEKVVGAISFVVDGHGQVVERSVTQPSGLNPLDAAALEAVREAAPYPTPPMGMPVGLKFTYGGKSGG
jgi:protein TonB